MPEWMEAGTYAGGNTCNARNDMMEEERREEERGNARDAEVRSVLQRRLADVPWPSRPCLSSLASSRVGHAAAGNVIAPVSSASFHYHSCLGPDRPRRPEKRLFDLLPAGTADVVSRRCPDVVLRVSNKTKIPIRPHFRRISDAIC